MEPTFVPVAVNGHGGKKEYGKGGQEYYQNSLWNGLVFTIPFSYYFEFSKITDFTMNIRMNYPTLMTDGFRSLIIQNA